MITPHMLARSRDRRQAPRLAHEITLHSRALARLEARERHTGEIPQEQAAPRRPARAALARAWARALAV